MRSDNKQHQLIKSDNKNELDKYKISYPSLLLLWGKSEKNFGGNSIGVAKCSLWEEDHHSICWKTSAQACTQEVSN